MIKIALIQLNTAWEAKEANYAKAERFFNKAARESCDIIVFPEMFNTGFSMNISAVSEDEGGETSRVLSHLAKKYGLYAIAGFAEKASRRKKAKNLAVAFDRNGSIIARYAKMHPFSFKKEDKYFSPGNTRVIFHIEDIPVSVFICYDLRFPEIFRDIASGVQMIFVLANWPDSRKDHWETLLKARAIENHLFLVESSYGSPTQILDPNGEQLALAPKIGTAAVATIDLNRRYKDPWLGDMRARMMKEYRGDVPIRRPDYGK